LIDWVKCSDVSAVALDPTNGRFATAARPPDGDNYGIDCWTLGRKPAKRVIPQGKEYPPQVLAFSPDRRTLAAAYPDSRIAWYDSDTGKLVKKTEPVCWFAIVAMAFHPSGRYLACGSRDQGLPNLFLIDLGTGTLIDRIAADPRCVSALCFSPSGDRLATFGGSGTVKIWDVPQLLRLERN
jgi:WD40 repeat protein